MLVCEERRKRKRVALHWPIRLFRSPTAASIETITENLTSNGFFCFSREPFELGERLDCIITIPPGSYNHSASSRVCLQCRVRVTRVEDQAEGFGLGCYIEDYDLLVNSPQPHSRATAAGPDSFV